MQDKGREKHTVVKAQPKYEQAREKFLEQVRIGRRGVIARSGAFKISTSGQPIEVQGRIIRWRDTGDETGFGIYSRDNE